MGDSCVWHSHISIDYTLASVFEPWGFPPSQDKRAETSKIYLSFIVLFINIPIFNDEKNRYLF